MRFLVLVLFFFVLAGCCCPIPVSSDKNLSRFTLGYHGDLTAPYRFSGMSVSGMRLEP